MSFNPGNRRLVLVSFADSRYRNALKRLEEMTRPFPFTERHFLTEKDVPRSKWRQWKPWLYRRGYGYWAWKPYVIRRQLEQMDEGDILIYSDAGIKWNSLPRAMERFEDYLHELCLSTSILVFEEISPEYRYTKMDCIVSCLANTPTKEFLLSSQLWAGCIFLKKSVDIMTLLEKYENLCDIRKEIVTDKASKLPNSVEFIEHRHDQSIFSCLVKQMPHKKISYSEWGRQYAERGMLDAYPIQGMRTKEYYVSTHWRIVNKLLRPWRMVLNVYFRRIRGYYFECPFYPW